MKLAAYLRVSTEVQVVDGFGLGAQHEQVTAWAARNGHEIVAVCPDEGVSGTLDADDRPKLVEALDLVKTGDVEGIIVARLDRLARSLTVQEATLIQVWRLGGRAFTCDTGEVLPDDPDDPMRTFIRQVLGAVAQLERAMIAKRMRDGRKAKRVAGGKADGVYPFGWDKSGEVERERGVLAHVRVMRAAGRTWKDVAEDLNRRSHFHPRTSEQWTVANLHKTSKKAGIA